MWMLLRVAALAVLGVTGLLVAGQAGWLLDVVDRAIGELGIGPLPRDGGELHWPTAGAGLVLGAAVALAGPSRRVVGQLVTLLHELGHTVVAAALGARPAGIVLRHDASGHATARWRSRPGPLRRISLAVTAVAGLPAPAVATAAGAGLLVAAGPRAVLWSMAAAAVVVALLARSAWSLLVAAGAAGLAVAGLSDAAAPWAAGAVVALLAAVAVTAATDAVRRLRLPIPVGDDARAVQDRLRLPARLVQGVQVAGTLVAAGRAVWLLSPADAFLAVMR